MILPVGGRHVAIKEKPQADTAKKRSKIFSSHGGPSDLEAIK
jgi:hypothetical protein